MNKPSQSPSNSQMPILPKVAVIIPIYNVQKYLRECLDSILHQTYQNLEIILVDDGSTDTSASIAKEYFDKDSRVSLLCKNNGGQGSARNMALEYLCGGLLLRVLHRENNTFISRASLKPSAPSAHMPSVSTISTGGGA